MTVSQHTPNYAGRVTRVLGTCAATLATLVAAAIVVMGAADAYAATRDVRVTVKYRVTSNEVVGEQRFLTLVGTSHSAELGATEVTSSAVATPPSAPCSSRTANEVWTTPTGSLEVETEGVLCAGEITGTWTVAGGSGAFANASGSGAMRGTLGGQGNVVISYIGDISD